MPESTYSKNRSPFSKVRLGARYGWDGPKYVSWNDEGESYFGMLTILLQRIAADADLIDTRSVYANLFDDSQDYAVLRATYWDGVSTRKIVKAGDENYKPIIPAKFVQITMDQVRSWLHQITDVSVPSLRSWEEDLSFEVRRVRIEPDYRGKIVDFVWQSDDVKLEVMNQCWKAVWNEMSTVLSKGKSLIEFEEDFWIVEPRYEYELNNYDITRVT